MHIAQVLADIHSQALSSHEKGRKLEKLIQGWFLANPVFKDELANV